MNLDSIDLIYFSPTGTTQKIITHIARGIGARNIANHDLTLSNLSASTLTGDVTLIGAPVYAGRVAPLAVARLRQLTGQGKRAIVVVLYGNREYEDALLELANMAESAGFEVVAAGAFIGEHSYATAERPIAMGRPNTADLDAAKDFGRQIAAKLAAVNTPPLNAKLAIPGNYPYKEGHKAQNQSPITDAEKCILCGTCATVCPTQAITVDDAVTTVQQDCIACCACIKSCPTEARIYTAEPIIEKRQWLYENCSEPKKPVVFL